MIKHRSNLHKKSPDTNAGHGALLIFREGRSSAISLLETSSASTAFASLLVTRVDGSCVEEDMKQMGSVVVAKLLNRSTFFISPVLVPAMKSYPVAKKVKLRP